MLLYFLIPSLLTFGSVELFLHWLRTWLHTEGFWQLCSIWTKTGDHWEWLLQHLCHCCKQSVHVAARLYVCYTFHSVLIPLKGLRCCLNCFWGQLRNRTRRENSIWTPCPLCKMSTHLLTLLLVINSEGKCPADIKDLNKTWLKPGRIFHSL